VWAAGVSVAKAGIAKDGQGLPVVFDGLDGLAEPGVEDAEDVQHVGFAGAVAELPEQGRAGPDEIQELGGVLNVLEIGLALPPDLQPCRA